jgi:hypothetical protein
MAARGPCLRVLAVRGFFRVGRVGVLLAGLPLGDVAVRLVVVPATELRADCMAVRKRDGDVAAGYPGKGLVPPPVQGQPVLPVGQNITDMAAVQLDPPPVKAVRIGRPEIPQDRINPGAALRVRLVVLAQYVSGSMALIVLASLRAV